MYFYLSRALLLNAKMGPVESRSSLCCFFFGRIVYEFTDARHDAVCIQLAFLLHILFFFIHFTDKPPDTCCKNQTKLSLPFLSFFLSFSSFHILVPSKPLNLSVLEVTSTTITIGWREPENLNGAIMGYRVFYINQNQTYFATIRSGTAVGELITYVLNDLSE